MNKRYKIPKAKPGELLVCFGRPDRGEDPDICYCWPDNNSGMKRDSGILMSALEQLNVYYGKSLRQELEARGYDIETLRFSIRKRPAEPDGGAV